ncbi:hypothetical protein GS636_13765 [Ruegeria sp. HKCCD4884]|uniref:pentapeptide repeat-containing protein n=1 Tax=Ruegeria sp. HKCCD4884 TaxID=2683022 RepID=UPI00149261D6|nr:pentapeptide repeat-containing protein [Ruegeria sp. HKCCD4884]NOD93853.1 hypothetical protein [Ruegeria sp. HKCCD4884]
MIFWILIALGLLVVGFVASKLTLFFGYRAGKTSTQIKDETDVAKSVFGMLGAVAVVFTLGFSLNEFALKERAEDRQQLYGALGQLVAVDAKRPEISAAAILQLARLGEHAPDEVPALLRILTAYINENARAPVVYHDDHNAARPDLQIAMFAISELIGNNEALGSLVILKDVDLRYVSLEKSNFPNIRMQSVDLSYASFQEAVLINSVLTGVRMEGGVFTGVHLDGAKLDFVEFQNTNLAKEDFCDAVRLNSVTETNSDGTFEISC